ncbi:unnamed protein product [Pylaiella littoralis]
MRVAWSSTSRASLSAARSFAATLLLFVPSLQATRTASTDLLATARPKQLLLRKTLALALANPLQLQHGVRRSSSSCSSSSSSNSRRRSDSSSRLRESRDNSSRASSTPATSTMDDTNSSSAGSRGSSSGGDVGLTLPMFLERCSSRSAREQERIKTNAAATAGAAPPAAAPPLFHVFSGNEACDADSMCSAICMAFLRQLTAGAAPDTDGGSVVYVPVMPIPRADLALRREVLVLFELCGIEPSAVIFSDELDLPALQAERRLRLTLVDHNAVSGGLSELGDAVVEIVDHHMDLGEHPSVQGGSRDIAFDAHDGSGKKALVGSCCTMVAERMLDRAPASLSSDVARLLLGVVLVDTVNLDTDAKRATKRDVAAAEELSRRVSWISPSGQGAYVASTRFLLFRFLTSDRSCASRDALFDTLRNAKMDPAFWRELSVNDCLRYDYKSFLLAGEGGGGGSDGGNLETGQAKSQKPRPLKFGMSSILCRLETLAEKRADKDKGAAGDALRVFAATRGLDSLTVMTVIVDENNALQKEILVFTHSKLRCDQMREYFEGPNGEFLKLERTARPETSFGGGVGDGGGGNDGGRGGWFLRWELGNARPSRKQVAPAIAAFYDSVLAG